MGNQVLISKAGREYKILIKGLALLWRRKILYGRISVHIQACPPDKRARDLDNLLKCVLDSLEGAGLFVSDSQVDRILIERMEPKKDGCLLVKIEEM